jgi:acetoin:2,6-dichlorophenolindophenol oxidoreductase subunit beta
MPITTYLEAGKAALAEEMRRDPSVWALGEDLGRGGVFGQYRGLIEEFGPRRIVDTPISESTILGAAVGAALTGTRPVVEMRFADFALCAIDELVNQAAKARYMFGGQCKVPIVVREPMGMWRSSAAQHSQSLEAWYVHIPGLIVVAPSTPADNKGLLKSAIRADDPVVYLEHKNLWALEGEVPSGEHVVPIGKARIARQGKDVTIVSWSATVGRAEEAAVSLAKRGISVEIIDLRTLWPWDREAVLGSVAKTGRLLVAHEAVRVGGFGAEIAATVAEELGRVLAAPVRRLGAPRIPISYSPPLEAEAHVTAASIEQTVAAMLHNIARPSAPAPAGTGNKPITPIQPPAKPKRPKAPTKVSQKRPVKTRSAPPKSRRKRR